MNEITENKELKESNRKKQDVKRSSTNGDSDADNDLECVNKNLNSTFTPFKLSSEWNWYELILICI